MNSNGVKTLKIITPLIQFYQIILKSRKILPLKFLVSSCKRSTKCRRTVFISRCERNNIVAAFFIGIWNTSAREKHASRNYTLAQRIMPSRFCISNAKYRDSGFISANYGQVWIYWREFRWTSYGLPPPESGKKLNMRLFCSSKAIEPVLNWIFPDAWYTYFNIRPVT